MAKSKTLQEQFPIEAKFEPGDQTLNPDNYFRNHETEDLRRRYIRMNVLMDYLEQILELQPSSNPDAFLTRIIDLMHAANKT